MASFPDRLIQLQHGDIVFRSCDWAQGGGGESVTGLQRRAAPTPLPSPPLLPTYVGIEGLDQYPRPSMPSVPIPSWPHGTYIVA